MHSYELYKTPYFEKDFRKLDHQIANRITDGLNWLAQHPEQIPVPLKYMPADLHGLRKFRIGDYRVFFWADHRNQTITLYGVEHRRSAYK